MAVGVALAAPAGLTANAVFKKRTCPDCFVCCSQVSCLDTLREHFRSAEYELEFLISYRWGQS
jgi:hypothetical protein